jgi:serine/threonine-protein kinase SRPK3
VALKIMSMYAQGQTISTPELEILFKIRNVNPAHPGRRRVISLLDHLPPAGPNGVHDCMAFELLGQTLEAPKSQ